MIYLVIYSECSTRFPSTEVLFATTSKEEALNHFNYCKFTKSAEYSECYELFEMNGSDKELIVSKYNSHD